MNANLNKITDELSLPKQPATKILSLTEPASDYIKKMLASENQDKNPIGMRVDVKSGGCSGQTYLFDFVYEKNSSDEEILDKGVRLFISPTALMFIIGSVLDYQDTQFRSGLIFINPNEKGTCGCGKSFHV